MTWKRVSAGLAMVASLALGSAVAAGAGTERGERPTVEVEDVTFTISWENCSELSEGSTIEGTGTLTSATTERPTGGGATAVNNVSIAVGTATDQAGNTYSWIYDNRTWVSNTVDAPNAFAGLMVDKFLLSGDGPEFLDNGFSADYSYDSSDETATRIIPWDVFGDPLDFEALEARCDPL
jgi:hypothetical protein